MRLVLVTASLMLALSGAASADGQSQPAPAAQQAKAETDKDKKVCKMMYHQGSLIRTQMCKTQAQWDFERTNAQRGVADFQNRNYQTSNGH